MVSGDGQIALGRVALTGEQAVVATKSEKHARGQRHGATRVKVEEGHVENALPKAVAIGATSVNIRPTFARPKPLILGWGRQAPIAASVQTPPPHSENNGPSVPIWLNDIRQSNARRGSATVFLSRPRQTASIGIGMFSMLASTIEVPVSDVIKVKQKQGPNATTCTLSSIHVGVQREVFSMFWRAIDCFPPLKKRCASRMRTTIGKESL